MERLDTQHSRCDRRSGPKGFGGEGRAEGEPEVPTPALGAGSPRGDPPLGDVAGEHQVGADQAAPRAEQPPQERRRRREGRVGDSVKGPAGEPEVGGIGLHDEHGLAGEAVAQEAYALDVELDGHDAGAGPDECVRERARTGPDVEHEGHRRGGGRPARGELPSGYRAGGTPRRVAAARTRRTMTVITAPS